MARINFNTLDKVNDEAAITAAIEALHKRSDTLQMDVHKLLVAIAVRWAQTGDVRPAVQHVNKLLEKGKFGGMRANAIKAWVETFFGFKYVTEGERKDSFIAGAVKGADLRLKEIGNTRWWEFKPEAPYKPLDFDKMLLALLKKAEDRSKDAKPEDDIDTGLLEAIRKARAAHIESQIAH